MAVPSEQRGSIEPDDPFEIHGPSPLPAIQPGRDNDADPIAAAERRITDVEHQTNGDDKVTAHIALADAWGTVRAIAPALEVLRQARTLDPEHPGVLERLGKLLSHAGAHREAGEILSALARITGQKETWLSAGRELARAEANEALDALLETLLARFPNDATVIQFAVEAIRARPGHPSLVPRLVAAARFALAHQDLVAALHWSLDAWVESRGRAGAEFVAQALVAQGKASIALLIACDAAARALAAGEPSEAVALLSVAGQAARAAGLPTQEALLHCVAAMFRADPTLRETARDLLAETDRWSDLAARLRANARRETDPVRAAAAWKGVSVVEKEMAPDRAARALGEALACEPSDAEARQLLAQLADHPRAAVAAREALLWATRPELGRQHERSALLVMLGDLELRAGDPAGAWVAYDRACKTGEPSAQQRQEAIAREAEEAVARADAAWKALETAPREDRARVLEELIATIGHTPGAVRDLARATRILAPLATANERAAEFWLAITRRFGDTPALVATLRRIATRTTHASIRARAAVELAEILDRSPEGQAEAIEVLLQLLDEQPDAQDAVATLAAVAEHGDDLAVDRYALAAMARTEPDPIGREILTHLAGEVVHPASRFAVLNRVFDETLGPRERSEALKELMEWVGESPALLARRTRALLALAHQEPTESIAVAQHFARTVPLSPEATIAWFGAARLVNNPEQMADAAVATMHSLAAVRDAASVVRAAISCLFAMGESERATRVAHEAVGTLGLADRGLRATVLEYVPLLSDAAVAVEVLEAAVAATTDAPNERLDALKRLAQVHRTRGDATGETHALRRLIACAPEDQEAIARLSFLLASRGDDQTLAHVLTLQLERETDPAERRQAWLTLAALRFRSGERDAALRTLDRYVEERPGLDRYADVVRALVAVGEHEAAIERLSRWADGTTEAQTTAKMYSTAARIVRTSGGPASRALTLLRTGLAREPESPELLLLAEEIATEARTVREMLSIYDDLEAVAAGEHGRRALRYRRAAFLEAVGEKDRALEVYASAFEASPVSGALSTAIERLAVATGRFEVLVAMYRRLAEVAQDADGRVRNYLRAAQIARERLHDRQAALDLSLLAHDVKRDEATARQVIDIARSVRTLDPHAFRTAVETVVERTLHVADEVWDDALKRRLALWAAEICATELGDAVRCSNALAVYFKGVEDRASGEREVQALFERVGVSPAFREALGRLPTAGSQPSMVDSGAASPARSSPVVSSAPRPEESLREEIRAMAKGGDRAGALARALEVLARVDDEPLRQLAEELARETGNASAELELIDYRLERTLDSRQRFDLILRSAELLRGPLDRPSEARRRLEIALASDTENEDLLRALHEVVEQLGAWDAAATLLARRIARTTDRAERRALRLHRAAVLEQKLNDVAGARAELQAVLEDEPSHRPALRYLADLYVREQRYHEAGECLARAAHATPIRSEAAALLTRAAETFALGKNTEDETAAETHFRQALELDPGAERALQGLTAIARRRGDLTSLERTLIALAERAEAEDTRVTLHLAAARVALEAGALFRAKGHVDAVRRIASPEQVAELDALLREARDNDRPISRRDLSAVAKSTEPVGDGRSASSLSGSARRSTPTDGGASLGATAVLSGPSSSEVVAATMTERRPSGSLRTERAVTSAVSASTPVAVTVEHSKAPAIVTEPSEQELREAMARGDDAAARALAQRLARTEEGRPEALRIQRQRFQSEPTRLDALEAMVGLYHSLGRGEDAIAVRSVLDVLSGREPSAAPPPLHLLPEPPDHAAARMMLPGEHALVGEIGAMLWESLGNAYRREITSYGVTGVDRVLPNGPTDLARLYAGAIRLLQLPRTALFVRSEVPGGAMPTRTQPPAVLLAAPLATDGSVSRYVLGHALEATRPAHLLACTLDPEERAILVQAVTVAFGRSEVTASAPAAVGRLARELFMSLSPRAQRRLQELLAELDAMGSPFSDACWQQSAEQARARAGLLVSGDFAVAARMVVSRYRGGGEPDVKSALVTLEPLRQLARFAVSEQYLLSRWQGGGVSWRR